MFIAGISFFSGLMLIVFSIVLYWKKASLQRASRLLAIAFLLLACWDFSIAYLYSGLTTKSDFLLSFYFPVDLIISLGIGPALYFYVRMLFDGNQFQWKKQLGYHALPIIPATCFLIYFATIPSNERIAMLLNESFASHRIVVGITVLYYIQSAIYFSFCLVKVKQLRVSNYQLVIDKEQTNIRWLMYLSVLGIGTTYIYLLVWIFSSSMQINILAQQCIFIFLIVYLFIQSLSSTGLSMQEIVAIPTEKESELIAIVTVPLPVESKSNISEQQAHIILLKLNDILERDQLYLSKKCSLSQLAQCSDIAAHHISTAINSYSTYNFSDFINKYRVDHVCRLLQTEQLQRLTLVAIGLECGFGSRANFFKTFKRFTGKTPTEYLIVQQSILKSVASQE
jgi:AraC-like DNA-binding protein